MNYCQTLISTNNRNRILRCVLRCRLKCLVNEANLASYPLCDEK